MESEDVKIETTDKNIYSIVPFSEIKIISYKIASGQPKKVKFALALHLFCKCYGLRYFNSARVLKTESPEEFELFEKFITSERDFDGLLETLEPLNEKQQKRVRKWFDVWMKKLEEYTNGLTPVFGRKRGTLDLSDPRYS